MKMLPLEHLRALIRVSVLLSWFMCVTQSAERDGDLLSQEKPACSQLSSSYRLCATELERRGGCTHRAGLEHFPFVQENARGGTSNLIPLTWWFLQQFRSFGVCISRILVLLQPG